MSTEASNGDQTGHWPLQYDVGSLQGVASLFSARLAGHITAANAARVLTVTAVTLAAAGADLVSLKEGIWHTCKALQPSCEQAAQNGCRQ